VEDEEVRALIPVVPFSHAQDSSLLARVASRSNDREFVDRLRLEFAGLCNQILSAEGLRIDNFDVLVKTCRRAAGYINVALEKLSGSDIRAAESLLRKNPLLNVFRVGFGMALRLKWDTERWLRDSWFLDQGFAFNFWGDKWGGILSGLVQKKPIYYVGERESEMYRDFETSEELEEVRITVLKCKVLDLLLEKLSGPGKAEDVQGREEITFYNLLFTSWAHVVLGHSVSFAPVEMQEAQALFEKLRSGDSKPPYKMKGYKQRFASFFCGQDLALPPEEHKILRDTLLFVWKEFQEEYQWIKTEDLDPRFSKFVKIKPSL